ncbi:MAG: hypothetical protein U0670_21765 [Anaerolineae bacterium]
MQNGLGLIFFVLFGVFLIGMYLLLRRRVGPAPVIAGIGIGGSVISVFLMTLAQGNTAVWAIVMGLVMGGLFSVLAAVAALYFSRSEARRERFDPTLTTQDDQ